ncbi:MAG: PAS domain S-box protein [Myxococcota bacterium]
MLGGLFFGHPEVGVFTARSEALALGLAAQAAVALDNARLYARAQASEQRYRQLVASLPAAVHTTDADGRIALFNDAAVELWGRAPTDADRWCASLRMYAPTGDPIPADRSPLARAVRAREQAPIAEVVIERPNGTRRHVIAHPQVTVDADGEVIGGVVMLVDITDRKRDEAELAATRDSLAVQVEALTQLHALGMNLSGAYETEPALRAVLRTLVDVHPGDSGLVALFDPATGAPSTRASVGLPLVHAERLGATVAPLARDGRVVAPDVAGDPRFDGLGDAAQAAGVHGIHATPIRTRAGEVVGVLSVQFRAPRRPTPLEMQLADLCVRHAAEAIDAVRAQQALRDSEERFREMADHAPVVVWVTDEHGTATFLSRSWTRLTGQRQEDGLGHGWFGAVHPDDRPAVRSAFAAAIEQQVAFRHEYRIRHADRTWGWAIDAASPRISADGRFLGHIGSVIDVTEEKRKEQALARSERLYRAIGESNDFGVWVCDPSGRNVYASDSYLALVGLTQAEAAGLGWTAVVHPDDVDATLGSWLGCIRSGLPWDDEHRVRGVDGAWHPILARGVPVRDDTGAITGWAGIHLDIARLKQVETELRDADQRKNEFLATLAHELRNPLAPLRNGLEILRVAGEDRAVVERSRAMMERQLRHMVRLIDDLLDLSRITQGKFELRRERIALADVVAAAVETSRSALDAGGHTFTLEAPRGSVWVSADLTRLSQVFANLLNNAARYTPRGGRIGLSTTVDPDGGGVTVTVRDTGVGIPPDSLSRVFEMFTQLDRSLERAQSGLGIGLSIALRLVEMHDGAIHAHSDGPGHGSRFVVRLPTVEAPAEAPAPGLPAEVRGLRILVADDNVDAASSLSMLFELGGNEVRAVHDGLAAVEASRTFQPDVVLLDIGMPRLNGYDACARIRALPEMRDRLIVALTGWGQEDDQRRSREAGFDHHLVQPVDAEVIEALIARRRAGG